MRAVAPSRCRSSRFSESLSTQNACTSRCQLSSIAEGSAAQLHRAWKTAQTLVEWASGIASSAAAIVAEASGVAVACTRKNVPGTKAMSVKAVKAGGAVMHRLGLSETLLLFAEHRLFLDEAPAQTVARLRRAQPEKKIVVEVGDGAEALRWAQAGADVLQLEKFSPAAVARVRKQVGQGMPVRARSGQEKPGRCGCRPLSQR